MNSKIKTILETKKTAKLSTAKLYYHLLKEMKINPKRITAADMLNKMHKRMLPSFDTVSRVSRNIRNK